MRRIPLLAWLIGVASCGQAVPPAGPGAGSGVPLGWMEGARAMDGQLIVGMQAGHHLDELPPLGGARPVVLASVQLATPLYMLRLPAGLTVDRAIDLLHDRPAVALLAANGRVSAPIRPSVTPDAAVPDDPFFPSQWGLLDDVTHAQALWQRQVDTSGVTVAVIDTGIDFNHPDLAGRVIAGYNFLDGNHDVQDRDGHGTHVAGIIGAAGRNRQGIAGICWNVKLLAVKVMDANGGTDFGAIAGIKYAVDAGAKVLNLSFSGEGTSRNLLFDLAVQYATSKGVVVVAAAGNQHGPLGAPANAPGVLAVSATSNRGFETLASFSNFGAGVFMAAPGDSILSDYVGGSYKTLSGTSMAAPFVSGAAAVLVAEHPDWQPDQVRAGLSQAVDSLPPRDHPEYYGFGRLDLAKLP